MDFIKKKILILTCGLLTFILSFILTNNLQLQGLKSKYTAHADSVDTVDTPTDDGSEGGSCDGAGSSAGAGCSCSE